MAQEVVLVQNFTLSIPNVLKRQRPEDYFGSVATIEWPLGPDDEAFPIRGQFRAAVVFREGRNVGAAKEFVRFLVAEGLARALSGLRGRAHAAADAEAA